MPNQSCVPYYNGRLSHLLVTINKVDSPLSNGRVMLLKSPSPEYTIRMVRSLFKASNRASSEWFSLATLDAMLADRRLPYEEQWTMMLQVLEDLGWVVTLYNHEEIETLNAKSEKIDIS